MTETRFPDTPETKIKWCRVPEIPDMLRAESWSMVIRRVYDDQGAGCTMYQLFDSSQMLDLDATLEARCDWRLVGWFADSHAAKEAAQAYKAAQTATVE